MPKKYKLTYFNGRARAEVSRLLFAQAGVEYEDFRIERSDWPGQHKANAPNGQLPYIEIDGQKFSQSNAISRYLAKQFNLYGKTPEDGLRVDMVVDTVDDALKPIFAFFSADEAKKAELKKKFEEEQYPEGLKNLEKILIANKGGNGFFVGDSVTWADLMFFNWAYFPTVEFFKCKVDLSKTPKLAALYERVKKLPKIAAWLEKRPETAF